ncbi:hypothetical protein MASSI9I_20449 [Massilia sp. 9I]|nr:hypothetical protein MASSI9I_20449 [Massilia sp. 9I]
MTNTHCSALTSDKSSYLSDVSHQLVHAM